MYTLQHHIQAAALVQSTLVCLMKYVPDSAGDLGSETETSTRIITKLQESYGLRTISTSLRLVIVTDHIRSQFPLRNIFSVFMLPKSTTTETFGEECQKCFNTVLYGDTFTAFLPYRYIHVNTSLTLKSFTAILISFSFFIKIATLDWI